MSWGNIAPALDIFWAIKDGWLHTNIVANPVDHFVEAR